MYVAKIGSSHRIEQHNALTVVCLDDKLIYILEPIDDSIELTIFNLILVRHTFTTFPYPACPSQTNKI